jgi:hypothetical protein
MRTHKRIVISALSMMPLTKFARLEVLSRLLAIFQCSQLTKRNDGCHNKIFA